MSFLTRYKMKDFLYKIITDDEKWVLYDIPKRKKLTLVTINIDCEIKYLRKKLLSIWWNMKGVIYYELLQLGQVTQAWSITSCNLVK